MTLLGKNKILSETNDNKNEEYRLPAVVKFDESDMPFYQSFLYAVLLHPLVIALAWLLLFVLSFLGFSLFEKPKMPARDIEFVLVDKEGTPINKNTKFRSDKNSRAGGIHDPNRKVSMPQAPAPKGEANSPKPQGPKKKAEPPKQKPQPKQKEMPKQPPQKQPPKTQAPQPKQPPVQKPVQPKPQEPPKTTAPKVQAPKVQTQAPKAPQVTAGKSDFKIPVPKSVIPQVATPSTTAPIRTASGSGSGVNSGSAAGKGSGAPSPSFSPSSSRGSGSGSGGGAGSKNGRFSGTGTGSGNVGNPGPGNPNGAPGIDAIKEPDFGPYMKELQRRIKMNWDPPKGNESKRVVVLFKISRDGRLLSINVHKSSGLEAADTAAVTAIKLTAPFKPLPAEYKGQSVDIQFTFDYNVFGGSLH